MHRPALRLKKVLQFEVNATIENLKVKKSKIYDFYSYNSTSHKCKIVGASVNICIKIGETLHKIEKLKYTR